MAVSGSCANPFSVCVAGAPVHGNFYAIMPLDQFVGYFFGERPPFLPFSGGGGNEEDLRTMNMHFWHFVGSILLGPFF